MYKRQGTQSAIGVDAHVIAALAGDESVVNPVADGVGRGGNRTKTASPADVAEIPVSVAVKRTIIVIKMGVQAIGALVGIQHEGGLSRSHGGVSPEFNGDFVGRNNGAEVGNGDVLTGAVENHRVAKRAVGGRIDFHGTDVRTGANGPHIAALVGGQGAGTGGVNGGGADVYKRQVE